MIWRKLGQERGGFASLYKEVRKGFLITCCLSRDLKEIRTQVLWISEEEHSHRGKVRCKGPGAGMCYSVGGTGMRRVAGETEPGSEG